MFTPNKAIMSQERRVLQVVKKNEKTLVGIKMKWIKEAGFKETAVGD